MASRAGVSPSILRTIADRFFDFDCYYDAGIQANAEERGGDGINYGEGRIVSGERAYFRFATGSSFLFRAIFLACFRSIVMLSLLSNKSFDRTQR